MIPLNVHREIESSGEAACTDFGLSEKDSSHLMTVLRDTIYSDKVLAVLREYGANAWDAHRMVGKNDVPIQVILPTWEDPVLKIIDFGPGLSHEDVFTVFTKYGASTKRGNNDAVGMLGIGCKAGFAYNDSFNVISKHNGKGRVYNAALDPSNRGQMRLMDEFDCGEETGLTIEVPVKYNDIPTFEYKAKNLYKYFVPQPNINITLDKVPVPDISPKGVVIVTENHHKFDWYVVMGCIAYPIDDKQVHVPYELSNTSGILFVDVGTLNFSASREALKYNDSTKKNIEQALKDLLSDYQKYFLLKVEEVEGGWNRRLIAKNYHSILKGVGVYKNYVSPNVNLAKAVNYKFSSKIGSRFKRIHSFDVNKDSRLVIRDDKRLLDGFNFKDEDIIVYGSSNPSDIDLMIEQLDIKGITVVKSSQLEWNKTKAEQKRYKRAKCLIWDFTQHTWTPIEHTPSEEDVYVIIPDFRKYNGPIMNNYNYIVDFMESINENMPNIYCYKKEEDAEGILYDEWRKDIVKDMCVKYPSLDILRINYSFYDKSEYFGEKSVKAIEELGPDHLVSKFIQKIMEVRSIIETPQEPFDKLNGRKIKQLACFLNSNFPSNDTSYNIMVNEIYLKYPLLQMYTLSSAIHKPEWLEYMKLWNKV